MDLKKIVIFVLALVLLMAVVLGVLMAGGFFEEKPAVVGLCLREEEDPVWAEHYQQLLAAMEEAGYVVELRDASNDQSLQNQQIDTLIEEGCRLFVIEPVMTSAAQEVVSRLESVNAAAVFIGNEPDAQLMGSHDRISYVGSNWSEPGMLQGQIILNTDDQGDINGDGVVSFLVLQGDEDDLDVQLRTQHCDDALVQNGLEVQRLELSDEGLERAGGQTACARGLRQLGKDIEVIFCSNDEIAMGAVKAIEEGGRTVGQDIYLVGADATRESLQLVAAGKLTGTVLCDYQSLTDKTLEVLMALHTGSDTGTRFLVDYILVDADNVSQYAK